MDEMEETVLPVISKSSTYKKMIIDDHHAAVNTHLDLIYISESFAREGTHPSWNTTLLGPVAA